MKRTLQIGAVTVLALLLACSDSATEPLPDTREPRIIFVTNRDGNADDVAVDQMPSWSPEGKEIAFMRDRVHEHPRREC